MEFNATIDLIIKDLDEARAIIDDLKSYPGVPLLQVELAKAKCKSAGEVIALLKNIQSQVPSEKKKEQLIEAPEKKVIPTKKIVPAPKPETSRKATVIRKVLPDQSVSKSYESIIVADTFTNQSNSLNEELGPLQQKEDLSEVLKSKPLTNLSEAIGVNDKFLFLSEIFNDNQEAYNQAISRLDNINNLSDAKAVLMSYTGDNIENMAVKQLLDLVKRKFPSNE